VCSLLRTLLQGLEDYTTDQRGDVGSWIRIACIRALGQIHSILFASSSTFSNFRLYCPAALYHDAVRGILKQAAERLDNVRQEAGIQLSHLAVLPLPQTIGAEDWRIHGKPLIDELFMKSVFVLVNFRLLLTLAIKRTQYT
jgi:tubulin-specific chaperone D